MKSFAHSLAFAAVTLMLFTSAGFTQQGIARTIALLELHQRVHQELRQKPGVKKPKAMMRKLAG
jgi:hypothetical protein